MAFSTILTAVIIAYIILYLGMMAYDAFLKKDATDFTQKPEDEDVDISDEAGSFKPVLVHKDVKPVVKPLPDDVVSDAEDPEAGEKGTADGQANGDGNTVETDEKSDNTDEASREDDGSETSDKSQEKALSDDELTNRKSLSDVDDEKEDKENVKESSEEPEDSDKDSLNDNTQNTDNQRENLPGIDFGMPPTDDKADGLEGKNDKPVLNVDDKLPMVRINLDEGRTVYMGAESIEQLKSEVDEYAENGMKSKLGKLKIISIAGEEDKRTDEIKEALRLREEERKDYETPDHQSPPPVLSI